MPSNKLRGNAVDALEDLGLTESEARCFVALTQLRQGTAKEVSDLANIPRARVYEPAERLSDRGLVAVQDTSPKDFQAVSVETAIDILDQRYQDWLTEATDALQRLETADDDPEDEGIWTLSGRKAITDKVVQLIDDADEELLLMHVDERIPVQKELFETLEAAADRGVTIIKGSTSEEVRECGRGQFADAIIFNPSLIWGDDASAEGIGWIVMVDRNAILASAIEEGPVSGMSNETAIWGRNSGFDKVLRPILEHRIEHILANADVHNLNASPDTSTDSID